MSHITLVHARDIREEILIPYQQIRWHITAWEQGKPVLFADRAMIMIFDLAGRKLYTLTMGLEGTLGVRDITDMTHEMGAEHHCTVDITYKGLFQSYTYVPRATWERCLALAGHHLPTYARVRRLKAL